MYYLSELKGLLHLESIISQLLLAAFLGLFLIVSHGYFFRYLLNKNTIFLSLMLPATILVVVTVIKTNIFLALGMVGALSIVRYRTPVKSQYELAILFALISMGIIVGVNSLYAIFLIIFLSLIPLLYFVFIKCFPIVKNIDFDSISDGKISVSIIASNAQASNSFWIPKNGDLVRTDTNLETNEISMLLSFENLKNALEYEVLVKKNKNLKNISVSK